MSVPKLGRFVASPTGWAAWSALLLAAYLLVAYLGWGRTLIEDEVWALYKAGRGLDEQLSFIRADLVHPPLIYLIEHGWFWLFGQSDSAAKTLALLINVPTILVLTWTARRVVGDWRMASLLLCAIYLQIGSVTNLMRMYGLATLLTVTAMLLWDSWRRDPRPGMLLAWALAMTLLVYTHYFGFLLLAAFMAANLVSGPRKFAFCAASAVPAIMAIPWLLYVLPVHQAQGLAPNVAWIGEPLFGLIKLPYNFLTGLPAGRGPFHGARWHPPSGLRNALIVAAGVLHLLLVAFAARALYRRRPLRPQGDLVSWLRLSAIVVGIPVGGLYLFSLLIYPVFHARFLAASLPGYWLLVVLLGELAERPGRILVRGVFLPWVAFSVCFSMWQNAEPSPLRKVANRVAEEFGATHLLVASNRVAPGLYWEWSQRLGRSERIKVFSHPQRFRLLQTAPFDEFYSFEELGLDGVDHVWLLPSLSSDYMVAEAKRFLGSRGFSMDESTVADVPFLMAFVREEIP